MRKIIIDGNVHAVKNAIDLLTVDGEIDFDTLGYYMTDEEAFNQAFSEFIDRPVTVEEFISKYLEIADSDLVIA